MARGTLRNILIVVIVVSLQLKSIYSCDYDKDTGYTGSDCGEMKLTNGDYDEMDAGDWGQITTQHLQEHPAAAEYALQTPNTLTPEQKREFLNDPGTDLGKINFATVMQNHKYVDKKGQNFQKWLGTLNNVQRQEVWRQIGDFDGKLTSKEDWQRIMNQETIDAWFDNYKFGDILKFFSGLEFDEMIAAIVAFLTGDWDVLEPVHVPPEVLEEALQQSGYNVEELDYPSDTQLQLIDDHLIINGNNISLERLETGTHTITVNKDGTINIESTEITEETTIKGATGLTVESDGDFTIQSAESIRVKQTDENGTVTETTIVNGKGIEYREGKLTAEQAEIIFQDDTIINEAEKFETDFKEFTVEEAEMVYQNGLKVSDVVNTTFIMSEQEAVMIPHDDSVVLHINDSNENALDFQPLWNLTTKQDELNIDVAELELPVIGQLQIAGSTVDDDIQLLDSNRFVLLVAAENTTVEGLRLSVQTLNTTELWDTVGPDVPIVVIEQSQLASVKGLLTELEVPEQLADSVKWAFLVTGAELAIFLTEEESFDSATESVTEFISSDQAYENTTVLVSSTAKVELIGTNAQLSSSPTPDLEDIDSIVLVTKDPSKLESEVLIVDDPTGILDLETIKAAIEAAPEALKELLAELPIILEMSKIIYNYEKESYQAELGIVSLETAGSEETIITIGTSEFTLDSKLGIVCLTLEQLGVYIYADKQETRKDFAIRNPVYGNQFSFCMRKKVSQDFTTQCFDCGLVDFVEKQADFNGIIDYLRYPLKDGQISSLQLTEFYQSFLSTNVSLSFDLELIYIPVMKLRYNEFYNTVSRTTPYNYITIIENPVEAMHTMLRIRPQLPADDSIVERYNQLVISNNLVSFSNTRILPPNHPLIKDLI